MDAEMFKAAENNLKNLKTLFSKFSYVADRISVLHDSHLPNDPKTNAGNTMHGLDIGTSGSGCETFLNVTREEHTLTNDPGVLKNDSPVHEFEARFSCNLPYLNISSDPNIIPVHEFEASFNGSSNYSNMGYVSDWNLCDQSHSINNVNTIHKHDFGLNGIHFSNVTQDEHSLVNYPNVLNNRNPMHKYEAGFNGDNVYSLHWKVPEPISLVENQILTHNIDRYLNGSTQEEDRHLHYLHYLHEEPMFTDQVTEGDLNATDDGNDINVDELDSNVQTGDQRIKFDTNVTFEEGTKLDENERNRLIESVITKPKQIRGCDNSFMFVKTSDDKSPKKLCCPFCKKLFSKLPVHLEAKHKDEADVQKFLSFPKGSMQRRVILDSLRKTGQNFWNKNAELNNLELIPSRRPNPKIGGDGTRFITCPYCVGYYTKSSLRLHVKYKCPQKPIVKDDKTKGKRFITALATSVEARYHENASKALQTVFKRFRNDPVVRSLKFDWLITVYGNKLSTKNTRLKSPPMIRGRLRLISRFLRELKHIEPEVTDLATLYHPKYYDQVLEAIRAVAHFNHDTHEYGAPNTAKSCVTAVKQIGRMLIAEYIKRDDQEKQRLTQNFLTVFNGDVHDMINKTANENQCKRRRRRRVNLPSLDDLKLLNQYLQSESNNCYNELSSSFDYKKWEYLSKLTMISILIFNRKRVGDTEDITLEDFEYKETINERTNQQLFASLSDEAKQVAKRYSRMKVRGKLNRTVPVLLNQSMENSLNLLTSQREQAGISPKNEYLFALPPSPIEDVLVINAGATLRKFAKLSGAKNPASFNGTNLRKQLATMLVSLKLDDSEVADAADFMGHAELVHRNNYRQNTIDRQVVKMSQWLEAALGNEVSIDTERKLDDENRRKATELLNRLIAALGMEDTPDNTNSVAIKKRKKSSHVIMKCKVGHPSALKLKQSSDVTSKRKRSPNVTMVSKLRHPLALKRKISSNVTIKSKRVCVRNKKG